MVSNYHSKFVEARGWHILMYGVPFYERRKSVAFLALTDLRKSFLQQIHLVLVNVSLPVCT